MLGLEQATEHAVFALAPNIVWIDHHKSSIESHAKGIPGYRIDGVAACRLAWQWFATLLKNVADPAGVLPSETAAAILPDREAYFERRVTEPVAVRLAGEYDIWDKRDPDAELFQYGLRSQEITPKRWEWMLIGDAGPDNALGKRYNTTVLGLLADGKFVRYAKTEENKDIITACGFTVQFEGLTFLACNHARFNSFLFTAGIKPEHDALLGFKWTGKAWSVSLLSCARKRAARPFPYRL